MHIPSTRQHHPRLTSTRQRSAQQQQQHLQRSSSVMVAYWSAVKMWCSCSSIHNQPGNVISSNRRHHIDVCGFSSNQKAQPSISYGPYNQPIEDHGKWALAAASNETSIVMVKVGACRSKRWHQSAASLINCSSDEAHLTSNRWRRTYNSRRRHQVAERWSSFDHKWG